MDNRTWLWRKRSAEKTIVATDKVEISSKRIDQEVSKRSVKNLNEKLAAVLLDSHAKDDLVDKNSKLVQEATTGHEKEKEEAEAEAEAVDLKKELEESLRERAAVNAKLAHSDDALKKCMQQLNFFREEQEQRIHDAVMKMSCDFEKAQKKLADNLADADNRISEFVAENTSLRQALLVKEKLIEDLDKRKSDTDAEFQALMGRLDSTEKENAFLKYEFRVLEKELEIRNDELEYSRRSAEAAHKQQLESVKKITKLEAECQRLRVLMRKRLPSPAALVKMKSEVETLGRDRIEMRRRKMNPSRDLSVRDSTMEITPEFPSKELSLLIERLNEVEEENRTLKDLMIKKNTELDSSRLMCSRTASRLSQAEAQLKELSTGKMSMELARCSPMSKQLSLASSFDNRSDDGISSSGSWANALISELEHFRGEKFKHQSEWKGIEVSDMSLMDDFVEMEKLAIVSAETRSADRFNPHLACKELVHSKHAANKRSFDWLQVVLNAISEQKCISNRSSEELLEDIKIALGFINHATVSEADTRASSKYPEESDPLCISGYLAWKSPTASPFVGSLNEGSNIDTSVEETGNQLVQFNLNKSIHKIIELINGTIPASSVSCNTADKCSEKEQRNSPHAATEEYFVHVFQLKRSELSAVLQRFVCICNDLLSGKADLEKFAEELSFALDWIMNNCTTPKDASCSRDKIKKQFGWNESRSEAGIEVAIDGSMVKSDFVNVSEEKSSCLHTAAESHNQNVSFQAGSNPGNLQEENTRLKDELKNMEAKLESATGKNETLTLQLQESQQSIESLQTELKTLKESNEMIEDQIENQKSINEDLDTQLTVAKAKLNEVFQKFSSLEVELEYKNNCCEELEATCLELQLQLESVTKRETPNDGLNQDGKPPQNGWEISEASAKLAECQETILNLGKQLKALASPREAVLFDKVFSTTNTASDIKKLTKRSSLRDQMLAEDDVKAEVHKSPMTKEILSIEDTQRPYLQSNDSNASHAQNALVPDTPETYLGLNNKADDNAAKALVKVPSKKQGGISFLRKLLLRRKKGNKKKIPIPDQGMNRKI